jgi:hypothetical protein
MVTDVWMEGRLVFAGVRREWGLSSMVLAVVVRKFERLA